MENRHNNIEFTILMPCLNEEKTVAACVKKALKWMEKAHPEAFDRYKRALQNFQMDDLDEWIGYIRHAAKTD